MPHCKIEGGGPVGLALGPHAAAVPLNDALDSVQANPSAGRLVLAVAPLKGAKQPLQVGHNRAGPIIAHKKGALAVFPGCSELNLGLGASIGKLPGVVKRIGQHYTQQPAVTSCHQARGNGELDLPPRLRLLQVGGNAAYQRAQVRREW